MRKVFLIWTLLAAIVAHTPLKAQYFTLRSGEGKKVRVHLEELHHELRVSCLRDSLLLYEYFGSYHARMLGPGFLQITYSVRGGSGFGSENTDFRLSVSRGHDYLLSASVREYLRDGSHPAGLRRRYRPFVFRYNPKLMAFCSKTEVARSGFGGVEVNQGKECMQFSAGDTLPVVRLVRDSYYYADGSWYSQMDNRVYLQADKVIDKVLGLPVVRQKSAWVDSVTRHRHGISLMMLESADWPSDTGRYVLQAGYRSKQGFEPYFLFKVYQPDLVIKTTELAR